LKAVNGKHLNCN